MPETQSVGRLVEGINKVNEIKPDTFKVIDKDAAKDIAKNRAWMNGVAKEHEGNFRDGKFLDPKDGVNLEANQIVSQEPTVKEVLDRMTDLKQNVSKDAEAKIHKAADLWEHLGNKADELNTVTQIEALVVAEIVVEKSAVAKNAKQQLTENIIYNLAAEDFQGVDSKLIDLSVESYVLDMSDEDRNGLEVEDVTPEMLIEDPRFQDYREAITKRVQALSEKTRNSPWEGFKTAFKFSVNLNPEGYHDFVTLMDQGRMLSSMEADLKELPSLKIAKNYLSVFGTFQRAADSAITSQAVLDAMPIATRELVAEQKEVIDQQIRDAYDEDGVVELNETITAANKANAEQAKLREALNQAIDQEKKDAREVQARKEVGDLELQSKQLKEFAVLQGEVAAKGAFVLMELQDSQSKIDNFNQMIKDGKLPDALQNLINGDVGAELDQFISSGGKKGSIEAVRKLIGTTENPGELVKLANNLDNPQGFLTLNTLKDDVNQNRQIETGIVGVAAEDGTIQFRFATRQNGELSINQEIPVINLKPEQIALALTTVDTQETSLKNAQAMLDSNKQKYQSAKDSPAVDPALRAKYKGLVATSESQVSAIKAELVRSKAVLAEQLKATNANKTLGEAFNQMSVAQAEVAKEFYSADFNEMVRQFAGELKMDPSQVTAEVLATVVAEANQAATQAEQVAEYLNIAKTKGKLEQSIIEKHVDDINFMSDAFAALQVKEQEVASLSDADARKAAEKPLQKQRRELEKSARLFGEIINNDFLEAVPKPLRKGLKAVDMTATEFKKSVKDVLLDPALGFDSATFLKKSDGTLRREKIAEKIRTELPYSSEVKVLIRKAADALVIIDDAEASSVLRSALAGGDVQGFLERADAIRQSSTAEQFGARQTESNSRKLKELMSTPEGIVEGMKTGELYWSTAVDAAINGEASSKAVIEGLNALPDQEVRQEAARRFQVELQQKIKDIGTLMPGEDDPLAGNLDLAAQAAFVNEATGKKYNVYWNAIIDRASAEKKTQLGTE